MIPRCFIVWIVPDMPYRIQKTIRFYLFINGSVSPGREFCPFCVIFLKKVRAYCGTVRDSFVFSNVPEKLVLVGHRRRKYTC